MPDLSRRQMVIGGALLATAGVSQLYTPRRVAPQLNDRQFDAMFPATVGPWRFETASGLVLPPQDQLSDKLYQQLLTRVYAAEERQPVMMVLAYSSIQEGRLQVHRPEVCYPAAGFEIVANEERAVPLGAGRALDARFLEAVRGPRHECILYWTRIGDSMPTSWRDQRIAMARANLKGEVADGLLGRLSVISADAKEAYQLLSVFLRALVDSAAPGPRKLLIGAV